MQFTLFMRTCSGACCAGSDINDARQVATQLDIPHYVLDYESKFKDQVIDDFAQALATDNEDALNLGLEEISSITEGMGASIADLGSRISTVNNQREILEDTNLRYQDLLSNAQDLDYATAVTKLSAELLSLEAAQASFAKISQLSLFNYIR